MRKIFTFKCPRCGCEIKIKCIADKEWNYKAPCPKCGSEKLIKL